MSQKRIKFTHIAVTIFYFNFTSIKICKVKNVTIAICLCLLGTGIFAQKINPKQQKKDERKERIKRLILQEEEGAIIFHRQTVFGFKLNTDGYGMFLEMGRMKTARKTNLYSFELGERKHPKEEKVPSIYLDGGSYIYGKINNFYYAKLGYAQQRLIGNKGNKNGVAISAIYGGGLSLGLLKPYYIKIKDPQSGQILDIKYTNNDSFFLQPSVIGGATGFSKGFGEMSVIPGLYTKLALRFDYGRYNELVSALEVGIHVEAYTKKMEQIIFSQPKQLFFNAYAAIEFGSRK